MKFSAERENLLTALQSVIGVVERRQTMPILANLLLSAEQGKLSITATDLEVELVASADIKSGSDGRMTVPGRKLLVYQRASSTSGPTFGLSPIVSPRRQGLAVSVGF